MADSWRGGGGVTARDQPGGFVISRVPPGTLHPDRGALKALRIKAGEAGAE